MGPATRIFRRAVEIGFSEEILHSRADARGISDDPRLAGRWFNKRILGVTP